jgi:hypothetical protein
MQLAGLSDEVMIDYILSRGQTYVLNAEQLIRLKDGGVGDVNGHIRGAKSHTVCRGSTEFLVIVPDGTAITEYQLLKLRKNGDNREFRTVTGGIFHISGGATRDLVSFQSKKVRSRTYLVTTDTLSPGEYGFLPTGAIATQNLGSSGKINSFRVQE